MRMLRFNSTVIPIATTTANTFFRSFTTIATATRTTTTVLNNRNCCTQNNTVSLSALALRLPLHAIRNMSTATAAPVLLQPGVTRIGWIGTGVMGSSMCGHIVKSTNPAYPTIVYNRTLSKTNALAELGCKVASSPEEVAQNSDIVFTIVGYPSDVRRVYFGEPSATGSKANGILEHLKPGSIVVDMTTSEPSLAVEIASIAKQKNIFALDAPVSGGDVGARNATLSIMVGGDKVALETISPLFQAMGKNITYLGLAGSGQHTKMTNQILIATNMIGVCEGLLYASRAGLDPTTVISAISAGAAGSWSISNLGPRIIARNFDPGFYVEHFVKDLGIILSEAKRMKLALPGVAMAEQLYISVMALGHSRLGTQSLMLALEAMNGGKASSQSN